MAIPASQALPLRRDRPLLMCGSGSGVLLQVAQVLGALAHHLCVQSHLDGVQMVLAAGIQVAAHTPLVKLADGLGDFELSSAHTWISVD